MRIDEAYNELHARHTEATARKDMDAIADVSSRYDELLNSVPDELGLLFSCGTAHMQLGHNGLAIALYEKALRIKDLPEIWNNLGTAYKSENMNDKARECWERALALREDADYYNNMATLYINEGKPTEGLVWAERGLELSGEHPRLRWNHALLLLELGRWREGFAEYEYGIQSMDRHERFYSNPTDLIPMWDGSKGKRVVVYGEQGIGDEIMFASAIPDLMRDCEVVFECHPRMVGLFSRSLGVQCYGTRKEATLAWPKYEKLDARLPIGSLFRFYRSNGEFPKVPYLKADPKLVRHYRKRLESLGPGPYVGIGWRAGTKSTRDDLRSLKLKSFNGVMDIGGTFVSLQYTEDASGKVHRYREQTGRVVHHWPDVVESGEKENRNKGFDYDHTVALIEALDLCILPNTAAVHVCGALGKECWTITPSAPAWRYQLEGEQMPVYESVRQFRGGDAIERITEEYRNRWARTEPVIQAAG